MTFVALSGVRRIAIKMRPVTVDRARAGLRAELALLDMMGVRLIWGEDTVEVQPPDGVRSVDIDVTSIGIYSDHQPFFALMLLGGDRPAIIREQVWSSRFGYVKELRKIGAHIEIEPGKIIVYPSVLRFATDLLVAADLRAAAALLVAACATGAPTMVSGCHHLERGYESLPAKLAELGASVTLQNGA